MENEKKNKTKQINCQGELSSFAGIIWILPDKVAQIYQANKTQLVLIPGCPWSSCCIILKLRCEITVSDGGVGLQR